MVAADDRAIVRICPSEYSICVDWDWVAGAGVVDGALDWANFWLVATRGLDSLPSTVIRVAIAADIASCSMS